MENEKDNYDSEVESNEEYAVKEYDITASPNDFNIKTLFDFTESGALVIPGFQRNYVWDIKRASKLIESILLGLPIPQIFLYEESRNRFLVIDGQQRLMTIYYFIKQRFPRKEKRVEIRRIFGEHGQIPDDILADDTYFRKFNLTLLEPEPGIENRFNKLNYSTLGDHKLSFDMRTVRNVIVKQNLLQGDNSSVYEIFNRLNSGGVNLRPQEIRASLYHSDFYELLFRLNNNERWRKMSGSDEADLHMRDVEILLRSFAMLIDGENYKPSMVKFLNKFSKNGKSFDRGTLQKLEEIFFSFINASNDLPVRSFIGEQGRFATLFFESVFYAACIDAYKNGNANIDRLTEEKVRGVFTDEEFLRASREDTAGLKNVTKRLERAKAIIRS
jgi:uncharacterized protein with ParB-like and HNH nuclease domain